MKQTTNVNASFVLLTNYWIPHWVYSIYAMSTKANERKRSWLVSFTHLHMYPMLCRTRLRVLKILVMQFAVFRPLNGYIQAIIWTNQADTSLVRTTGIGNSSMPDAEGAGAVITCLIKFMWATHLPFTLCDQQVCMASGVTSYRQPPQCNVTIHTTASQLHHRSVAMKHVE